MLEGGGINDDIAQKRIDEMQRHRENRERKRKESEMEMEMESEKGDDASISSMSLPQTINLKNEEKWKDGIHRKNKKIKALKTQLESALSEVEDLQIEFESERTDLLQNIRASFKEMALYKQMVAIFLSSSAVDEIFFRAKWEKESEKWKLPEFAYTYSYGRSPTSARTPKKKRFSASLQAMDRSHLSPSNIKSLGFNNFHHRSTSSLRGPSTPCEKNDAKFFPKNNENSSDVLLASLSAKSLSNIKKINLSKSSDIELRSRSKESTDEEKVSALLNKTVFENKKKIHFVEGGEGSDEDSLTEIPDLFPLKKRRESLAKTC